MRMLWERYGSSLDEVSDTNSLNLTQFQRDGVDQARQMLDELNGVIIADEVGLGKTFIAGELLREATEDNRQRALVIAPATLRDGPWRSFLRSRSNLNVEVRSYEDLVNDSRLSPDGESIKLDAPDINDYALVVIDEAHNLRNPDTKRSAAVRELLRGSPPKKLVLMTATPVNNGLLDLYYLINLFVADDGQFINIGIPSLREHFQQAARTNPDDLSPDQLFDIIDAVAVRRTRSFVKTFFKSDTIMVNGIAQTIEFPQPEVKALNYSLTAALPTGFFDQFRHAMSTDDPTDPTALSFIRYNPERLLLVGTNPQGGKLAGLVQSSLLKRFESSPFAFAKTARKMAASHDTLLELLDTGQVAVGAALHGFASTDSDDAAELATYLSEFQDDLRPASDFDQVELERLLKQDRDLLVTFAERAETISRSDDPTLAKLEEELAAIAEAARNEGVGETDVRNRRKTIVFSYFADTVEWIFEHLQNAITTNPSLSDYRGRIVRITGDDDATRQEVLNGFAPASTEAIPPNDEDLYDIVVTTDVLAEGVNLQQAKNIVNYDLPWNPMRLVQRHGRIDRIGSPHATVRIGCIMPDAELETLLGLEETIQRKIKQAAASIGVASVLPGQSATERDFTLTRTQIENLRQENPALFAGGTKSTQSGQEYRQDLKSSLADPAFADQVMRLPWGSGTGMTKTLSGAGPSFVFAARVGDDPDIQYRYIDLSDDEPAVVRDVLTCLDYAHPTSDRDPRSLSDQTYEQALNTWPLALQDIVEHWMELADRTKLRPPAPKALRTAATIVRNSKHPNQSELLELLDQNITDERRLRPIRQAISSSEVPNEQAEAIAAAVKHLGLRVSPAPQPRPRITTEDVHLICWTAIEHTSDTAETATKAGLGVAESENSATS